MKYKRDGDELVLDDAGDPILLSDGGEVVDLTKIVSKVKHDRIAAEREEFKTQVDTLSSKIEELSTAGATVEEMRTQIEQIKQSASEEKTAIETRLSEAESKYAGALKTHAVETSLLDAGIPKKRLKAALALLDSDKLEYEDGKLSGLDVEALRSDHDYLFDVGEIRDSAAASRGGGGKPLEEMDMDEYAKARAAKE